MADLDRPTVGDPVPPDLVVVGALLQEDSVLVADENVLLDPVVARSEDRHRVPRRAPGDGILLGEAQRTLVSDNSVTDAGIGFPEAGGFGILLDGADDSLVQRNAVTGGNGPAIFVTSLESQGTSDRNVISRNVANSRLSDGILVNGDATATLLERNTANENGHDGIEISVAGTTVTGNTANFNHDLGIEAVPGVIDGGGNRARGNGNALQCTNVAC
jgi:parallel beta-helix repeat protein